MSNKQMKVSRLKLADNKTMYRVTTKDGKSETVNADSYDINGEYFSFRKGNREVVLYARDQVASIRRESRIEKR